MIDKIRTYLNYRYVLKRGINSIRQLEDDIKDEYYRKKYSIDYHNELKNIGDLINKIDNSYRNNILYVAMCAENDIEYRKLNMDFRLLDLDKK